MRVFDIQKPVAAPTKSPSPNLRPTTISLIYGVEPSNPESALSSRSRDNVYKYLVVNRPVAS